MTKLKNRKSVFLILDGFGVSSGWAFNAVKMNKRKNLESISENYPSLLLQTEFTNKSIYSSSLCHARISCGHEIVTDDDVISDFFKNTKSSSSIDNLVKKSRDTGTVIHLFGTFGSSGFFNEEHLFNLLDTFEKNHIPKAYLHFILVDDDETFNLISKLDALCEKIKRRGYGEVASVTGGNYISSQGLKYKIDEVYKALITGKAETTLQISSALQNYKRRGLHLSDSPPTVVVQRGQFIGRVNDFDTLFFYDTLDTFSGKLLFEFSSNILKNKKIAPAHINLAKLIESDLNDEKISEILVKRDIIQPNLPQIFSEHGLKQLYITEMISSYQATKGFSGFSDSPYPGSKWKIASSVSEYDYMNSPALSLKDILSTAVTEMQSNSYDFIFINVPNADLFAHLGSIKACGEAISKIDEFLGVLQSECLKSSYTLFITSDHGACEEMKNLNNVSSAIHTKNPVPFMVVDNHLKKEVNKNNFSDIFKKQKSIFDIAPTMLEFYGIDIPESFVGESLIE